MSSTEPTTPQESFNYVIQYAFEFPESSLRPDEQSMGIGTIPINTDHAIETQEDLMEVAREIGKIGGYEKVGITDYQRTDHFVEDTGEILEGLLVNE
jgi:hypothetical protein